MVSQYSEMPAGLPRSELWPRRVRTARVHTVLDSCGTATRVSLNQLSASGNRRGNDQETDLSTATDESQRGMEAEEALKNSNRKDLCAPHGLSTSIDVNARTEKRGHQTHKRAPSTAPDATQLLPLLQSKR